MVNYIFISKQKKQMKFSKLLYLALISITLFFTACKKDDDSPKTYETGDVSVEFENVVGSVHVDVFGTTNYTNQMGEQFTVTKLKYYITNVELLKEDGSYYKVPESYYLIDESVTSMHKALLTDIPGGVYKGIRYMVGVDSTRNVSGAQEGALDIGNDMFWTWNSGYIFFKMEGTSTASSSGDLTFHIGGFKSSLNQAAMRTVTLSFGSSTLTVDGAREAEVHIIADLLDMFKTPTDISFATLNFVMMPGANAMKLADNYVDMFTFDHIHDGE
jgi:hypothetical protein